MTPRILICAPSSGTGKTSLVCALLRAYLRRGENPMACKSGPDYIDPMFHASVVGAKSRNLDLFFFDSATARALLRKNGEGAGITILEGAMGYYDGLSMTDRASAYELAKVTETPAVLVVDGRKKALSIAAEIKGFLNFRADSGIAGVILNRVSSMRYPQLSRAITEETGLPVFGYLPEMPECNLESRHLGLVTAQEIRDLQKKLDQLGEQAEKTIDLDGLLALANSTPEIKDPLPEVTPVTEGVRIGIARDQAFCFYYEDSLDVLRSLGAELVEFSPILDQALPENIQGLYLGGGYPELYAGQLSENKTMRDEVRQAIESGMPTVAECGGFLYLHQILRDEAGTPYPMVGAVEGEGFPTGKLSRFGYVTLTAKKSGLLLKEGEQFPAHEFHYWDSANPGEDFWAEKPLSSRHWMAGYSTETLYAGFPHIHFAAKPEAARRFVECAAGFAIGK